jgi:hypothetical protein
MKHIPLPFGFICPDSPLIISLGILYTLVKLIPIFHTNCTSCPESLYMLFPLLEILAHPSILSFLTSYSNGARYIFVSATTMSGT